MRLTKSIFDVDKRQPPVLISVDPGNYGLKGKMHYVVEVEGHYELVEREAFIEHGYVRLSDIDWEIETRNAKTLSRERNIRTHVFKHIGKNGHESPVKIGYGAVEDPNNRPMYESSKYIEGGIDALICALFNELMPKGDPLFKSHPDLGFDKGHNNIILAIGHPPSEFNQVEHLNGLVKGVHKILHPDGTRRIYNVQGVVPFDEGAGGLAYLMNQEQPRNNGRFASSKKSALSEGDRVLIYDGGGRLGSLTSARVVDNRRVEILFRTTQKIEGGSITIRERFREQLRAAFVEETRGMKDKDMTPDWIDRLIKTGQWRLKGGKKVLDVSTVVKDSLNVYLNDIRGIYQTYFAGGNNIDHIILTGGTTAQLYEYIVDAFDHGSIILVDDLYHINMANVKGGSVILIDKLKDDGQLPVNYQAHALQENR